MISLNEHIKKLSPKQVFLLQCSSLSLTLVKNKGRIIQIRFWYLSMPLLRFNRKIMLSVLPGEDAIQFSMTPRKQLGKFMILSTIFLGPGGQNSDFVREENQRYSFSVYLQKFCQFKPVFRIRISFHSDPDSGSKKCPYGSGSGSKKVNTKEEELHTNM